MVEVDNGGFLAHKDCVSRQISFMELFCLINFVLYIPDVDGDRIVSE